LELILKAKLSKRGRRVWNVRERSREEGPLRTPAGKEMGRGVVLQSVTWVFFRCRGLLQGESDICGKGTEAFAERGSLVSGGEDREEEKRML